MWHIFLDIDDTTLDLKKAIIPFNNRFFGVELSPEEYSGNWRNTRWAENFKSQEEYGRMIDALWWPEAISSGLYESVPAMLDAYPVLQRLQQCDFRFSIITSRPAKIREATLVSLERELPLIRFEDMVFMGEFGHDSAKGPIVRKRGGDVLIDDVYDQIQTGLMHQVPSILYGDALDVANVVTNEAIGLYRARNWLEIESVLEKVLKII